jgi:hypothetical protein
LERINLEQIAEMDDAQIMIIVAAAAERARQMKEGGTKQKPISRKATKEQMDRAWAMTAKRMFGLSDQKIQRELEAMRSAGGLEAVKESMRKNFKPSQFGMRSPRKGDARSQPPLVGQRRKKGPNKG